MKKALSLLLASILAVSLAACGGNSASGSSDSSGAQQSTSETAPSTAAESGDDDAKVKFTFGEHVANVKEQNPWVYSAVQRYMEANPHVEIELTETTAEEHIRNMKMAAQSGNLPELFWMQQGAAIEMAENGYLADLTADITADAEFADSFLPSVLDSLKIDGKIYGIPCELQSNGFWLNKALFDQYSLELPVTFADMMNCAAVFQENGIVPLAQGAKDIFTAWAFENMHCRYGFYDHIDGIIAGSDTWSNPDYLKFYGRLAEMRTAGFFPENVGNMNYDQSVEMFISGKAVMLNSGVWDTKKFDNSDIAEHVYYWWGPTFDDGVGSQEVSMKAPAHPYVVSAKVQQEQPEVYAAVIDFLKFYYGSEGTEIIAGENQSIPVTRYTGQIDADTYPVFARVMERIGDDWASPAVCPDMYISGQLINQYRESMVGVVNGTYTPEQAAAFMDEQQALVS